MSLQWMPGSRTWDDQAHGEAQEPVDLAHPLRVALGQVFVHGDDVDALPRQGVQVSGQNGHQGLALAGFHFCNPALMEHDAADQLHRVGSHAQNPVRRLPADCKGLRQEGIQGLSVLIPLLELLGFRRQVPIGQLLAGRPQRLNLPNQRLQPLHLPLRAGSKNFTHDSHGRFALSYENKFPHAAFRPMNVFSPISAPWAKMPIQNSNCIIP